MSDANAISASGADIRDQIANGVMKKFNTKIIAKTIKKKPVVPTELIYGVAISAMMVPIPNDAATFPIAIHAAMKKMFCQFKPLTLFCVATLMPGSNNTHGDNANNRFASNPVHGLVNSNAKKRTITTVVFFSFVVL